MSEAPLFAAAPLRARFGDRTVLSLDELSIAEGGVTAVVGENGSGKTTLLRMLNGLLAPSEGRVEYRGQALDGGALPDLRADSVLVHQSPLLFRGSVEQNVRYGLRLRRVPGPESEDRVRRALARVGLAGFEKRRAGALSGGEMQRVAIARALVLEPRVLFLDEPTANVDPESQLLVERLVRDVRAGGSTVILSTHAMDLAYRLSDHLIRLERGAIVPSVDNILHGTVDTTDDDFTHFRCGSAVLLCPARAGSFGTAVLPMDELILSRAPLASSARNVLRGTVAAVEHAGSLLRVTVDCGVTLSALITPAAALELGVEPGRGFVVTFKASAVRLY